VVTRQRDGLVDAADRQHADRAAGAVDQFNLGRQQSAQAMAGDGVGVAAAELHQVVAVPGRHRLGDGARQAAGQVGVAKLIDVFHGCAPSRASACAIAAMACSVASASSSSSLPMA
jgi:hypothetical protein